MVKGEVRLEEIECCFCYPIERYSWIKRGKNQSKIYITFIQLITFLIVKYNLINLSRLSSSLMLTFHHIFLL